MKELKISLRILKFGAQMKTNVAMGLIFFLLGVLNIFGTDFNVGIGGFWIVLACTTVLLQVGSTFECSTMIASSSKRRALSLTSINIYTFVVCLASFAFVGLLIWIRSEVCGFDKTTASACLISSGLMVGAYIIYMGMAYKKMLLGLVVFLGLFLATLFLTNCYQFGMNNPFWLNLVISLGIIVACCAIASLLRLVLYKQPLSRRAVGSMLRRYM